MLTGKKIALFGTGSIGRILYAGAAAITLSETNNVNSDVFNDLSKITEPTDYTTLVKAYRKVQKKYYPEKDIVVKTVKNKKIF